MTSPARRLVVAYCFVPYVDTSGTVAAKRVQLRGEAVDVIQNKMDRIRPSDPGRELLVEGLIRRRAFVPSRTMFATWRSISEFCEAGQAQAEEWVAESAVVGDLNPGASVPWTTMYSRVHFIQSHFLAALIKHKHPDLHWEAEFSDPCSAQATGEVRFAPVRPSPLLDELAEILRAHGFTPPESDNSFVWVEHLVYALADEILFTNENQAEYMLGRCSDRALAERARARTVVAHHPTLPPRFYELELAPLELPPDRIHIGYFGNFYGDQSPATVVRALELISPEERSRLMLHIFTGQAGDLAEKLGQWGVSDSVRIEPLLPFFQFLDATREMDLLLVVDYPLPADTDINPFLLSKWGDYRGSGTPVWGVLEESSVLSRTTDPSLAFRTPLDHVDAAAQLLSQLARGVIRLPERSR